MPSSRIGSYLGLLLIVSLFESNLYAQFDQPTVLVGSGAQPVPPPACLCPYYQVSQGSSVALSADGNTAVVNGFGDYNGVGGAVWIFFRSDGVWSQQGEKLVGTGAVANNFGTIQSVAVSADGNTALLGRAGDNSDFGALWVFTRFNGVWSQEGDKLVGDGSTGPFQGQAGAVALSADGNTAVIDGRGDNHNTGAVWVFTRSNGIWQQQGGKLVGVGAGEGSFQCCPTISGDGNTILFTALQPGGVGHGFSLIFTRSNGVWSQQGDMLVGSDVGGSVYQGPSSALSSDGNTAILSGYDRTTLAAYAWVFTRSNGVWTQQGHQLQASKPLDGQTPANFVSLSADGTTAIVNDSVFTRDEKNIWRNTASIGVPPGPLALSADGSTILVGEPGYNSGLGATLVVDVKRRPKRATPFPGTVPR